jgi:hypothetical protein
MTVGDRATSEVRLISRIDDIRRCLKAADSYGGYALSYLTHSRVDGFLLRGGWFRLGLTTTTSAARVVRWHGNKNSATPIELVVQLATELEPALIEDGFVQARLGPNVSTRCLGCPCRRLGHIPHLQVLDTHYRVVLADRGRGLVQVVAPDILASG